MRARAFLLLTALLLFNGCSSNGQGSGSAGASGGSAGSGGTGGRRESGGSAGASAGTGGSGGSASPGSGGEAGTAAADAAPDTAGDGSATGDGQPAGEPGRAGGAALLVVGAIPLVRTDIQLHEQLAARGLTVEDILDGKATAESAAGKKLVILSYSIDSANVRGKFNDVPAPVMVLEHVLLDSLGMTTAANHGWAHDVSEITITAPDSPLAAGLSGDVTIFTRPGGVFWGLPAAGASTVATMKGNPARPVIFAYPAGAMMVSKPAPGKRMLFFLGAHLDTAVPLSPDGLELLDAMIDWAVAP